MTDALKGKKMLGKKGGDLRDFFTLAFFTPSSEQGNLKDSSTKYSLLKFGPNKMQHPTNMPEAFMH